MLFQVELSLCIKVGFVLVNEEKDIVRSVGTTVYHKVLCMCLKAILVHVAGCVGVHKAI